MEFSGKIAVVGCGALGSFYGARLLRAGQAVHFLLRSDYEAVRRRGVQIQSIDGDFHVHPNCACEPKEIGICDLVLVALKTTANGELQRLVAPLAGQGTLVLTLQNGLGNEEALAKFLRPDHILGGLCFVCLNRVGPGVIAHTAHGKIDLGEWGRKPSDRTHALAGLFRGAGIPCEVTENLAAAHWGEKLVWNIPFNGLGVAGCAGYDAVLGGHWEPGAGIGRCLPTDALLGDLGWESLVRELMSEVVLVARAKGYPMAESVVDYQMERTRVMQSYRASTLLDFERGQPLELTSMFLEPLRQAGLAGVATPRLKALCRVLRELEQWRQGLLK